MAIKYLKLVFIMFIIAKMFSNLVYAQEQVFEEINLENKQVNIENELNIKEVSCIERIFEEENHALKLSGARDNLAKHGIIPRVEYVNDSFLKLRGINNNKHVKSISLLDMSVSIDTEKLKLMPGGHLYISAQNIHGSRLSPNFIGDIQQISSIDAPVMMQLSEYWYEQSINNNKISIKLGKQDANCDFDSIKSSMDFLNSSFSQIPTIPMPTYPDQGLGAAAFVKPNKLFNIKTGFFDGELNGGTSGFDTFFDSKGGHFTIVEAGLTPKIKNLPGNYIAGYWYHSGSIREISANPRTFGSNYGLYTSFEQSIYKEKKTESDTQGLYVQAQFGWSPSDRNEIARYYGTSITYQGLISGRNKDVCGLGVAIADLSSRTQKQNETALEAFYKIQITPWLAIQPDAQLVFNPGGDNKNAFLLGIRTFISF